MRYDLTRQFLIVSIVASSFKAIAAGPVCTLEVAQAQLTSNVSDYRAVSARSMLDVAAQLKSQKPADASGSVSDSTSSDLNRDSLRYLLDDALLNDYLRDANLMIALAVAAEGLAKSSSVDPSLNESIQSMRTAEGLGDRAITSSIEDGSCTIQAAIDTRQVQLLAKLTASESLYVSALANVGRISDTLPANATTAKQIQKALSADELNSLKTDLKRLQEKQRRTTLVTDLENIKKLLRTSLNIYNKSRELAISAKQEDDISRVLNVWKDQAAGMSENERFYLSLLYQWHNQPSSNGPQ